MRIYNNEGIYIYNVKVMFFGDNEEHKFYNLTVVNEVPIFAYDLCVELWNKYNGEGKYNRMQMTMKSKNSMKSTWTYDGLNIDLL